MQIRRITTTPVAVPYGAPVGPYRGRGKSAGTMAATGLIVKVETDEGLVGWGEGTGAFSRNPTDLLAGRHPGDIEAIGELLSKAGEGRGPASGLEMALWDLLGKMAGMPVFRLMGGLLRDRVDFCGCQGLKGSARESGETAKEVVDRWGFRYIKTKAGEDPEVDLANARAIGAAVRDRAALRPDANSGYAPDVALATMARMKALGVGLFEDPCASTHVDTLVRIRKETGMEVYVNMGVGTVNTVRALLTAGAADALMPDTPAAGGLLAVRKVAAAAEGWGVPCLMHCSHDLGLKTAAVAHVAASTPNWTGPNDTCYHGLVDDVLTEKLEIEAGQIRVPTGPGLGVEVDEAKVAKYRT